MSAIIRNPYPPLKNKSLSNRIDYFKINFSPTELKVFELKTQRVQDTFIENDLIYNQPEFFRILMLNFDNPDLVAVMQKLYGADCSPLFKRTSL
jgi:hypothetical protein